MKLIFRIALNVLLLFSLSSNAFAQENQELFSSGRTNQTVRGIDTRLFAQNRIPSQLSVAARYAQQPTNSTSTSGTTHFRWAGEELYYSVRLNGVEAVRSAIKVGDIRYRGSEAYVPVVGSAQSIGFFHAIYPMRDTANTFVNPATFKPLRSEKLFEEKGKKRSYAVDFMHAGFQAKVLKTIYAVNEGETEKERRFVRAIPSSTHDMISWFFELRKSGKMKLGDTFSFYLYDGWKLSRIEGSVVGKEDVYTPIGWFKTFKIDFAREILRSKGDGRNPPELSIRQRAKSIGSIFISRDENLIPVAVRIPTKWGLSEVLLMKYKLPKRARNR